jgi:hypothetical protein
MVRRHPGGAPCTTDRAGGSARLRSRRSCPRTSAGGCWQSTAFDDFGNGWIAGRAWLVGPGPEPLPAAATATAAEALALTRRVEEQAARVERSVLAEADPNGPACPEVMAARHDVIDTRRFRDLPLLLPVVALYSSETDRLIDFARPPLASDEASRLDLWHHHFGPVALRQGDPIDRTAGSAIPTSPAGRPRTQPTPPTATTATGASPRWTAGGSAACAGSDPPRTLPRTPRRC